MTTIIDLPDSAVRLSILLVNYNGTPYLAKCLDSIKEFVPPETEVIMVDNASTDGSYEYVSSKYPWVRVVRSSGNYGFAAGNNLAGAVASGKFILLLNTDTVLLEQIAPAIDWLDSHAEYALLTINMLGRGLAPQACTGKFPSPLRLIFLHSMLVSPEQYGSEYAYEIDWAQGSFLLIRTECWRVLGGLDESYFMYAEDVDLCKRAFNAGWKCAYLPQIRYIHWGGYSPNRFPDQVRSLDIYMCLHMQILERIVSWSILSTGCFARTIFYRLKALLKNDETCRTTSRASWLAFTVLFRKDMWWRTKGIRP